MEVHHHPEVEKKGIKEYLLEGFMIFIAVTMGFFAESLREHINERHYAKEYAVSLYSDLKADTAALNTYTSRINIGSANIDTLMQLLSAAEPKDLPSGKLYWYGLYGAMPILFSSNNATLLEIKNSGSLRYFPKQFIRNAIATYDQKLQEFNMLQNNDQGIYIEVRKARSLIFDFKYNEIANMTAQSSYKKHDRAKIDSFINSNPPLLSYNKVLFNQYIELVRSRFLKTTLQTRAFALKDQAAQVITLLKNEYNPEDE